MPREIAVLETTALLLPVKYVVEKTLIFTRRDAGQRREARPDVDAAADPSSLLP